MNILLEVREHTIDRHSGKPWKGWALWLGPLKVSISMKKEEMDKLKEMLELWKRDYIRHEPVIYGPAVHHLRTPVPVTVQPSVPRDKEIKLGESK